MSEPSALGRLATGLLRALLAAAALGAPTPATARQQTEEELVRHLRELLPRLDSARAVADEARARARTLGARRPVASIDSFQVGPLRILTPSDQRRVAEGLFRDVWEREYAAFVDGSPSLERTTFSFQWSQEPGLIPVDGPSRGVDLPAWRPASAVRASVESTISRVLAEDLPASVASWAGLEVRDPRDGTAADLFRLVAMGPALSNRRCIEGDAEACWASLGLDLDDTPFDEWYSPEERRARVALFGPSMRMEAEWRSCVDDESIDACDLYLSQTHRYPPLADASARRALVWISLDAGGQGAWDRLRADPTATPGDALRAASRLDTDELATRWRDWLLTGAPPARARLDPHFLIDLMWIVALAAFATRSTRWRLR